MDSLQRFKIPACILSVILLVVLGVMIWRGHQEELATQEALEQKNAEAQVYLDEIEQLESELNALQDSADETEVETETEEAEYARAMVGFCMSTAEDVEFISSLAEEYGFTPVVVLNCKDDIEDVKSYIDATADRDWEYMLTGTPFTDEMNENILLTLDYLEESGLEDSGFFLLRTSDNGSSKRLMLKEDGFEGYTLYSDTPISGVSDETGMLYFSYAYVQTFGTSLDAQIEYLTQSCSAMITVFDMGNVNSGKLTETEVRSGLDSIYSRVEAERLVVTTVRETADAIAASAASAQAESEASTEDEAYEQELQERIDRLWEQFRAVYAEE